MKKVKIFSIIFSFILLFVSCETEVIDPAGIRGINAVTAIVDVNPAIFIDGALETSYVEFMLESDSKTGPKKGYIVASYNGTTQKKRLKDVNIPEKVNITAKEAIDALGMSIDDVSAMDYFVFEVAIDVDGETYYSNGAVTVKVVCPFDPELTYGNYTAYSSPDEWDTEGDIEITVDSEDPYTVYVSGLAAIDGLVEDGGPLVMHINQYNFEVTAPKVVLASTAWSYTNIAFAGSGEYNSCTGEYVMRFSITVDQGSFGSFIYSFTRKDE